MHASHPVRQCAIVGALALISSAALYGIPDRILMAIYAVEEFHQPCFHVMVHRKYQEYARNLQS